MDKRKETLIFFWGGVGRGAAGHARKHVGTRQKISRASNWGSSPTILVSTRAPSAVRMSTTFRTAVRLQRGTMRRSTVQCAPRSQRGEGARVEVLHPSADSEAVGPRVPCATATTRLHPSPRRQPVRTTKPAADSGRGGLRWGPAESGKGWRPISSKNPEPHRGQRAMAAHIHPTTRAPRASPCREGRRRQFKRPSEARSGC